MSRNAELAIVFADVVGSTKLYELMGDSKARETVAQCIDVMTAATTKNDGKVIKTMGDEVMATFEQVDNAAGAACQMQMLIRDQVDIGDVPVAIRVGFHFGPVMLEGDDVFGGAVHIANRMTSQAKAEQIITSEATVQHMSEDWQQSTRQIDVTKVRGAAEPIPLFEVLWQQEDNTRMLPSIQWPDAALPRNQRLLLRYRGQEIICNEARPNVTIGRSEDSDLMIKDTLISRLHARIEFRRGKFMLVDQSTNGTCVLQNTGEELFVRRDSLQIKGQGAIGLGRVPQADSPQAIYFTYEE
ncbi:MAG: adenylate/guanylate cyclase domain-containing protein [Pseudomonadota bacterium]